MKRLLPFVGIVLLAGACILWLASPSEAADRTAVCEPWKFDAQHEGEGGSAPAAFLPCPESYGLFIECIASDFIGAIRYYPEGAQQDAGYRLFRFAVGAKAIDAWLRLEEMDGAWAGYSEFAHPLFTLLQAGSGAVTITDVAQGSVDILPLKGSAKAFEALLAECRSSN